MSESALRQIIYEKGTHFWFISKEFPLICITVALIRRIMHAICANMAGTWLELDDSATCDCLRRNSENRCPTMALQIGKHRFNSPRRFLWGLYMRHWPRNLAISWTRLLNRWHLFSRSVNESRTWESRSMRAAVESFLCSFKSSRAFSSSRLSADTRSCELVTTLR